MVMVESSSWRTDGQRGREGSGIVWGGGYIDEDIAVTIFLLQEERIRRPNDVGFRVMIGEEIKLLKGRIGAEETALAENLERKSHVRKHCFA